MLLHEFVHFIATYISPLENICLPDEIEGRIIQVLGLEGRCVDHGIALVIAINHVLLS